MRLLLSRASCLRWIMACFAALLFLWPPGWQVVAAGRAPDAAFLRRHCYECHQGKEAEAGLDLASLSRDLEESHVHERWVRIYDRVENQEMPPADSSTVTPAEAEAFLAGTSNWLRDFQRSQDS